MERDMEKAGRPGVRVQRAQTDPSLFGLIKVDVRRFG